MTDTAPAAGPARVIRARNAVAVVFALNGFAFSNWMARIPQIRDLLEMTPSELGRVLLALSTGAVAALPMAGVVVNRIGAARTVAIGSLLAGAGLIAAGSGAGVLHSAFAAGVSFGVLGYGSSSWVAAMNVAGAAVERRLSRSIMPRFHAAFSLGGVAGAGLGAAVSAVAIPLVIHLTVIGATTMVAGVATSRSFLPRTDEIDDGGAPARPVSVGAAWREPRTLAIGVMVLCFGLMEGIANDWLALGIVDGYDVENAVGAVAFAVFVAAMTAGRAAGTVLIDRYGRLPVLRVGAMMAATGVLLVGFGGSLAVAAAGIVIWGLGASLGFPLGMSAASDDPRRAATRVSVVASIGYVAFLAGPPLLGWIGDHEGVRHALLVVAGAAVVGFAAAPAARTKHPIPVRSE